MRLALNLLPPDRKVALRSGYVFAYVQTMLVLAFLLAAIASATVFSVRFLLSSTLNDLAQRSENSPNEFTGISMEIKEVNDYITRMDALSARLVPWSETLKRITDLAPTGTRITRIRVDAAGMITVSGIARTRADMLAFGDQLRDTKMFGDISSPLSNILQQKDVKFEFQLTHAPANSAVTP